MDAANQDEDWRVEYRRLQREKWLRQKGKSSGASPETREISSADSEGSAKEASRDRECGLAVGAQFSSTSAPSPQFANSPLHGEEESLDDRLGGHSLQKSGTTGAIRAAVATSGRKRRRDPSEGDCADEGGGPTRRRVTGPPPPPANRIMGNGQAKELDASSADRIRSMAESVDGRTSGPKTDVIATVKRESTVGRPEVGESSRTTKLETKSYIGEVDNIIAQRNAEEMGDDQNIVVMSWNVDGLNDTELLVRTMTVIEEIREVKPPIVMLQEVIDGTKQIIERFLNKAFWIIAPAESTNLDLLSAGQTSEVISEKIREFSKLNSSGSSQPYYCLLLISKWHFDLISPLSPSSGGLPQISNSADLPYVATPTLIGQTFLFGSSKMGRHLLMAKLRMKSRDQEILVITTHAESCKEEGSERQAQFNVAMKLCEIAAMLNPSSMIILGGDLNARDAELRTFSSALRALSMEDAWESSGRPPRSQFTWDTSINKNARLNATVRCRFDRVFVAQPGPPESRGWKVDSFRFCGTNQIAAEVLHDPSNAPQFPSDHFGLLITIGKK